MRPPMLLLAFLLPFIRAGAQVQQSPSLAVVATDFDFDGRIPRRFADTTDLLAYLSEWQQEQIADAFWEASVDSIAGKAGTHWVAYLHRGPAYAWSSLHLPPDERIEYWARRAGYRPRRFADGRPLSPRAWQTVRDSIVAYAAREGHPFASVALTDIEWVAEGRLKASIDVRPGPLIRVGEVRVPESVRVRNIFLERYLGLVPGEPYSQRRVRRLGERLAQLPYVSMRGGPRVSFRDSLAYLDLPLQRRPASRFDFIIGVLPNSTQNDGKLLITGELNGELYNGFGQGERVAVRFEQLKPQTQELELAVDYPFLFGLPFGFEGELALYRRDSSFLNLNWELAATYLREGNDRLSAFWQQRTTIVPGLDSTRLVEGRLPDTLGVSRSFFGLQLRRNRTDRRFSPRNGYTVDLSTAAGFRRLRNLEFAGADSVGLRSTQFELGAELALYVEPLVGTVVYLGLRARALLTDREVLVNEQYRIGGARIMRGFEEQELFATDYQILTAEFRLLLGERAFLYTFVDAARLNGRSVAKASLPVDYPIGLGAGVNFETRAGIFALSLGVGKRRTIPFDLGAPKVHLGYVSVF